MLLKDKVVVITGSNRGIGKEIVTSFAHSGATIYACARSYSEEFEDYINQLIIETKTSITPIYFEMSDDLEMLEAIKNVKDKKMKVDVLVNNMGIAGDTLFQMTKKEHARKMMDVNFFCTFQFTQYVLKLMDRKKGGSIVNISSVAAQESFPGMVSYAASKAAIESMTRTLSRELGSMNIRVNAIAPGFTQTEMIKTSITNNQFLDNIVKSTSLNRLAEPKEIANVALFLASNLSSYITGQVIRVDGGM